MPTLDDKFSKVVQMLDDLKIPVTVEPPQFVITQKPIGSPDLYTGTLSFDFRGISLSAFQGQPEIWQLVSDALASYLKAVPKSGSPSWVVPSILIEESSMQIVFVLDFHSLEVLKDLLISNWQKISRLVSTAPRDSALKSYKALFVHVSNDLRRWKYLVSHEYSDPPIQDGMEFLNFFITPTRISAGTFAIAKELERTKLWEEAITEYKWAINATSFDNPYKTEMIHKLAYCYLEIGKYSWSIDLLKNLIASGDAVAMTHYNLAWSYRALGEAQGGLNDLLHMGIRELSTAIQMDPNYYDAHYNLVCYLSLVEEYDKALSAIDKAHKGGLMIARELKDDSDCAQLVHDSRFQQRLG